GEHSEGSKGTNARHDNVAGAHQPCTPVGRPKMLCNSSRDSSSRSAENLRAPTGSGAPARMAATAATNLASVQTNYAENRRRVRANRREKDMDQSNSVYPEMRPMLHRQ